MFIQKDMYHIYLQNLTACSLYTDSCHFQFSVRCEYETAIVVGEKDVQLSYILNSKEKCPVGITVYLGISDS